MSLLHAAKTFFPLSIRCQLEFFSCHRHLHYRVEPISRVSSRVTLTTYSLEEETRLLKFRRRTRGAEGPQASTTTVPTDFNDVLNLTGKQSNNKSTSLLAYTMKIVVASLVLCAASIVVGFAPSPTAFGRIRGTSTTVRYVSSWWWDGIKIHGMIHGHFRHTYHAYAFLLTR